MGTSREEFEYEARLAELAGVLNAQHAPHAHGSLGIPRQSRRNVRIENWHASLTNEVSTLRW